MLEIRPYRSDDRDAAVALWHACGLVRPWNDPYKDIARKLTEQPELFLVGCVGGQLVATAMAGYDGHRGWVYYLAVDQAHQRGAIGRQMMDRVEALLLAVGCPKISLMVRSTNAGVIEFYRRLGYAADESIPMGKRLIPDL